VTWGSDPYAPAVPRFVGLASAVAVAISVLGCGGGGAGSDQSAQLYRPDLTNVTAARAPVNELAGTYAGVHLDAPVRQIADQLGAPPPRKLRPDPAADIMGYPEHLPADTPALPTYGDVQFTLKGDRVASMLVWGLGARTLRQVGIGDDQAAVRAAYTGIRCSHSYRNGEYVSTPRCEMELGARRYLYFGGDPVFVIGLSTADFRDRGIGSK
jgi:hypothetical protein